MERLSEVRNEAVGCRRVDSRPLFSTEEPSNIIVFSLRKIPVRYAPAAADAQADRKDFLPTVALKVESTSPENGMLSTRAATVSR